MKIKSLNYEEMRIIDGGGFWDTVKTNVDGGCVALAVVGSFAPAIFANPIGVSAGAFCAGWGLASYATEKFL